MLTSKVAVVKSHHGISVKCSRYRDTGPTDPSLIWIYSEKKPAVSGSPYTDCNPWTVINLLAYFRQVKKCIKRISDLAWT